MVNIFTSKAEAARTRGTPVTIESFNAWKAKFDKEMSIKRAREDDEKLRGLTAKEREEFKKIAFRFTGSRVLLTYGHETEISLFQAGSCLSAIRAWPFLMTAW